MTWLLLCLLLYPAVGFLFWVAFWVLDWRQGNHVGVVVAALSLVSLLLCWPLVGVALVRRGEMW